QIVGIALHRNFRQKVRPHLVLNWDGHDDWESVPIELASMMVSQSSYKDKERLADKSLEKLSITITGELPCQVRRTVDDTVYRCYTTNRDVTISVTNFELARVLFFHNQYLIRAAFSSGGVMDIAHYNQDPSDPKIIFPDSTNYPVSNIRSRKSKSHLAWLLTDPSAAKSFFSIFKSVNEIDSSDVYDFGF
ncbi:hypothetical protein EA003_26335, partial [Vibrio anguillarum]|nr:hypothetical protein [Vibrio anguillarum]